MASSKILFNDKPCVFGRNLARLLDDVEAAAVMQQMHYAIQDIEERAQDERNRAHYTTLYFHEGEWWIVGTYNYLTGPRKPFDFINPRKLRRILDKMEASKYIISEPVITEKACEGKRYRIDHDAVNALYERAEIDPEKSLPPAGIGRPPLPESADPPAGIGRHIEETPAGIGRPPLPESADPFPIMYEDSVLEDEEKKNSNSKNLPSAENEEAEKENAAVVALLISKGIWRDGVGGIAVGAETLATWYTLQEIQDHIADLPNRGPRNSGAMLADVLRTRKPLTPEFLKQRKPKPLRAAGTKPAMPVAGVAPDMDVLRRALKGKLNGE